MARELTKLCKRQILQGHVWAWMHRYKQGVPSQYCPAIEMLTQGQVTREQLRPDVVWGSIPPLSQDHNP